MGLCMGCQVARVLLTCFCCNLGPTGCHEFNVSQMKCARKKFEDVSDFFSAEVHHLHGSLCKTKQLMLAVCTCIHQSQVQYDVQLRITVTMNTNEMGWHSTSLSYTFVNDLYCLPVSLTFTLLTPKAGISPSSGWTLLPPLTVCHRKNMFVPV